MDIGKITRAHRGTRVAVTGILRSTQPATGPLSQLALAGFDVVLTYCDVDAPQKRSQHWPFMWIEDGTGRIGINPDGGRVRAPVTAEILLDKHDRREARGFIGLRREPVTLELRDVHQIERGIADGILVTVQANVFSDQRGGFRTSANESLELVAGPRAPIVLVPA
jgi:hypothetical protein